MSNENKMISNIGKKKFFKLIEDENIDLGKVVLKQKSSNVHFHKFNLIIRNLYKEQKLTFIDIVNYLFEDMFTEKEVMDCFSESNKYYLRRELGEKYNIKMGSNILKKFLKRS